MNKIYIIQHCQSEHHVNELTGGWTDTPLTQLGMKQAQQVANELKNLGVEKDFELYSSDLKRASMTAEAIEKKFNVEMILDKSLREHNNGKAANKSGEWARKNFLYHSSRIELDKPLWENAETYRELYNRMKEFKTRVIDKSVKDIIIVSHGVAIGYLIWAYLNIECDLVVESFIRGGAGGVSILSKSPMGQNTLNLFNSSAHLNF